MGESTKKANKDIAFLFLLYWILLVAWQNILHVATGSTLDSLFKMALLFFLLFKSIGTRFTISTMTLGYTLIVAFNLLITWIIDGQFTLRYILNYIYPVVFAFVFLGINGNYQITSKELVLFLKGIIACVLFFSLYAVIFDTGKFLNAFSISSAYGHELTSIFVSNHEYGLYLMAGIISCLLCIKLENRKKWFYIASICLFAINIVLTYSRTSLFATAILAIISMRGDKRTKRFMGILVFLGISMIIASSSLRDYIFNIVMKGNNDAGRFDLMEFGFGLFRQGSLITKLWGYGVGRVGSYISIAEGHKSLHNAYLQTLVGYGLTGCGTILLFLYSHLKLSLKTIRINKFMGSVCCGLLFACVSTMFTNTAVIFTSPVDSFFLTIFSIIIPRYVMNAVIAEVF